MTDELYTFAAGRDPEALKAITAAARQLELMPDERRRLFSRAKVTLGASNVEPTRDTVPPLALAP